MWYKNYDEERNMKRNVLLKTVSENLIYPKRLLTE